MGIAEVASQLALATHDVGSTARPRLAQLGVDADDLPDRSLLAIETWPFAELHSERLDQVGLEGGVVGLRRGDDVPVQHAPVDRKPLALLGLHLVRDRDVRMQVWVTGAGVAVGERGGDEATGLDLARAVLALAGEQCVLLDEGQCVRNSCLVGSLDLHRDLRRRDRPQCGDRLHRTEGQVEPGNGGLPRPRVPRQRRRQFSCRRRLAPCSATKNSRAAVERAVARSAGVGLGVCASSSSTRALKASTVSLA